MMKIFVVCGDGGIAPSGTKGASVHLRALAGGLAVAGHSVSTFVAAYEPGPQTFPTTLNQLSSSAALVAAALSEGRPDVIYERYSIGHLEGLAAARELDVPFVLEVNAPLLMEAQAHRGRTITPVEVEAERRLFREAQLVVAVSEPLRRYVSEVRGTSDGTAVVHNGCDPSLFPTAADLDREPPTIAFLGHPKPWHGAAILPSILAGVLQQGHDASLLIIGGGPGATEVQDIATTAGLGDRVTVTGPLPHPQATAQLRAANVAVAPYPSMPFFYFSPLKLVECMAAGLPVVTTPQGDIPTILGTAGMLVPAGDIDGFATAIGDLLKDRDRRRRLGEEARGRALSRFSWDAAFADLTMLVTRVTRQTAS